MWRLRSVALSELSGWFFFSSTWLNLFISALRMKIKGRGGWSGWECSSCHVSGAERSVRGECPGGGYPRGVRRHPCPALPCRACRGWGPAAAPALPRPRGRWEQRHPSLQTLAPPALSQAQRPHGDLLLCTHPGSVLAWGSAGDSPFLAFSSVSLPYCHWRCIVRRVIYMDRIS